MTDGPNWDNSILFIPQYIVCPNCNVHYHTISLLNMLLLPDSIYKCKECCDYIFTIEYVGKFFGVIKDVGESK